MYTTPLRAQRAPSACGRRPSVVTCPLTRRRQPTLRLTTRIRGSAHRADALTSGATAMDHQPSPQIQSAFIRANRRLTLRMTAKAPLPQRSNCALALNHTATSLVAVPQHARGDRCLGGETFRGRVPTLHRLNRTSAPLPNQRQKLKASAPRSRANQPAWLSLQLQTISCLASLRSSPKQQSFWRFHPPCCSIFGAPITSPQHTPNASPAMSSRCDLGYHADWIRRH
jgi:hypothetical protein